MTDKEYEEYYCLYCDSQRCHNVIGGNYKQTCPYWYLRKENKQEKEERVNKMPNKLTDYEEVYGTMTTTGGSAVWFGVYTGKHDWSNDNE